ncbi:MAG: DUF2851 family protein [Flavobacteriales bacterium]|nr:MAG: DUF2851 family protein [Flavobacteriales bacterium]
MTEDLLHFIWKYKRLPLQDLVTSNNEVLQIIDLGTHNLLAGPDFFNAHLKINGQLWAGNVEIHQKSSDWYVHTHERDTNYDNVILHVVWQDDARVFRSDNSEIPTLELQKMISPDLLLAYLNLFDQRHKTFINCEKQISQIKGIIWSHWLDRLYIERLESKSDLIFQSLLRSNNDWEQVLFSLLLKNFGSKVNAVSFMALADVMDYATVRKLQQSAFKLESVFLGLSGLLDQTEVEDKYYKTLRKEYHFLKRKFGFVSQLVPRPDFFKLRPHNFPTIRLSQLAELYAKSQNLFNEAMQAATLKEYYELLGAEASAYWKNHFTFGKTSKQSAKRLTKPFINLLLINSILPLKYAFYKTKGLAIDEAIIEVMYEIGKEANHIIDHFEALGITVQNAMESQSVLQLYNEYCSKNKCLQCAVAQKLLQV